MTDEERMLTTSEIRDRLQHASTSVTRAWIHAHGLKEAGIDLDTRENKYRVSEVEQAISESVIRGPYRRRASAEEPPRDDHHPGLDR